jgi:hypothetical protein
MQLEEAYIIEITKLMEYVDSTEHPLIQIVRTHQNNTKSATVQAARSLRTELRKGTRQIKDSIAEKTKEKWRRKRVYRQFLCSKDKKLVDNEQSYQWLKFGNIKGETESTIVTAQDQAISTNCVKNKILKEEVDSKCRLCKQHEETIDHLTSGCPILVKNEYLMRHDKVVAHLRYSVWTALGIGMTDKWHTHTHTHTHTPVCEHEDVTVLRTQGLHTDREVTASKPDIVIKNEKEKTCILMDVEIPVDRNVTQKKAERKLEYKSLCIEMQRMWSMKCMIMPLVI